jgi:hypothetical protein
MFKDFNRVTAEPATSVWPFKKVDRIKIQLKGNRLVMVLAGSGRYQEGRRGLARNKEQKT